MNDIDSWLLGLMCEKVNNRLMQPGHLKFSDFFQFAIALIPWLVIQVMFSIDDYTKMADQEWFDLHVVFTIFTSQLQIPFQSLFI